MNVSKQHTSRPQFFGASSLFYTQKYFHTVRLWFVTELFWSWDLDRSNDHSDLNHLSRVALGGSAVCPRHSLAEMFAWRSALVIMCNEFLKLYLIVIFTKYLICWIVWKYMVMMPQLCPSGAQGSVWRGWLKPKELVSQLFFAGIWAPQYTGGIWKWTQVVSGDCPGYSQTHLCQISLCQLGLNVKRETGESCKVLTHQAGDEYLP